MNQQHDITELVKQWLNVAERALLTAKQGLESEPVFTDSVCFNCQQSAEKYLKAFRNFSSDLFSENTQHDCAYRFMRK